MPTASTLLPRDPSVTLRYRVKLSRMLTDEVLKSTHLIEVSALRTRSLVSNCSIKLYYICVITVYILNVHI